MAHCRKIVYLVGLCFLHDPYQVGAVGHVAIVQAQFHIVFMEVLVEMIDPVCVNQ
jgi:hypothetical protein